MSKIKFAELFSGIGVGSLALRNVFGSDAECAFFSEINNQCVRVFDHHFPGHKNVGHIDFVEIDKLPSFDLLIGGSPCQDLSIARGKREGLDGDQSGLFYKFLDILREKKPKYFMLENVASMKDEDRDEISRCLGVQPVMINSVYFTGQERKRYYWCNFPILPTPTEVVDARKLIDKKDVPAKGKLDWKVMHSVWHEGIKRGRSFYRDLDSDWDVVGWSRSTRYKEFETDIALESWCRENSIFDFKIMGPGKISYVEQRIKINMGVNTLVTGKHCARMSSKSFVRKGKAVRQLNRKECARFQGLPDDYLEMLSDSAAYSALGNSFTLDVIEHIMISLKSFINQKP
jgi:DNA (cytosine-5)-methyltransferase 3A